MNNLLHSQLKKKHNRQRLKQKQHMKMYKYIGKGQYVEVSDDEISNMTQEEVAQLVELKNPRRNMQTKDVIEEIKSTIQKSGYKNMTVNSLVKLFGNKKRSLQIVETINLKLKINNLFTFPNLSMDLKPSDIIRIYDFPVECLGDIFDSEYELETFMYDNNLFHKLNLEQPIRQFSPNQTRDKLDFKCIDKNGNQIALELKNKDGGKSSVEQVLRYLGMLKQQFNEPVKGILVTGVRSVETAKAIHGMTDDQKKTIDWYLYKYNKTTNDLDFEKVEYDYIAKFLSLNNN